jgi:solute carrier family 25 phosphate transporter 23/24/25/41
LASLCHSRHLGKVLTSLRIEFRIFVEQTEKELHSLFQSIDKDKNGKLDKEELQVAFKNAGLQVLPSKLNQFFSEVDTDRDGVITFEEWR